MSACGEKYIQGLSQTDAPTLYLGVKRGHVNPQDLFHIQASHDIVSRDISTLGFFGRRADLIANPPNTSGVFLVLRNSK